MSRTSSIPPRSEPPPSSRLPGRSSSNGPYILGIVAFGAMSVGLLLYWKQCSAQPELPPPPPPPVLAAPPTVDPGPVFAPPPPPEPTEEPDAAAVARPGPSGGTRPSTDGMCEACGKGVSSPPLEQKVAAQAGLARGCYNRALRTSEVSGSLTVSVSVGADGRVCSASIVDDNVGSSAISNCVLSKFQGTSFPRPQQGCVVINVPIAFKTKK